MQNADFKNNESIQKMIPNILFFNEYEVSPNYGGIERVTSRIASALLKEGYKVYSAYVNSISIKYERMQFTQSIKINPDKGKELINFLQINEVDIIILQNTFNYVDLISNVRLASGRVIKTVFVHHMHPESEYAHLHFGHYRQTLFTDKALYFRDCLRLTKWGINYLKSKYHWIKKYRKTYDESSAVVLLSSEYVRGWCNFAKLDSYTKFKVIPNPRTYDYSLNMTDYDFYKNQGNELVEGKILIVSRLEENPKKISKALEIYREIFKKFPQWQLIVVGDGPDLESYKEYTQTNGLSNVSFEGLQKPFEYYKKCTLFMMTSDHEAFPLTLLEAQQLGCIPLAFNSFGSVNTIIKNGKTGFVIPKGNIEEYKSQMMRLIETPQLRREMAENAIKYSEMFTINKVIKDWIDLFKNLIEDTAEQRKV